MSSEENSPEARISEDDAVVTLINVFTVEPVNQQQLVELWQQATEDVMRDLQGFISASIHRSFDGTKVINYAQWESREAFGAIFRDPRASAQLTKLAEVGTPDPVLCEVVSVHRARSAD
jgi:heme-degrading monooxygenase HmoA